MKVTVSVSYTDILVVEDDNIAIEVLALCKRASDASPKTPEQLAFNTAIEQAEKRADAAETNVYRLGETIKKLEKEMGELRSKTAPVKSEDVPL
jgi:hypothetical protein